MRAHLGTGADKRTNGRTDLQGRGRQSLYCRRSCRREPVSCAMHQFMIAMRGCDRFGLMPKRFGRIELSDGFQRFSNVQAADHARIREQGVVHCASDLIRNSLDAIRIALPCRGYGGTTKNGKTDSVRDRALERCSESGGRDIDMTAVEE